MPLSDPMENTGPNPRAKMFAWELVWRSSFDEVDRLLDRIPGEGMGELLEVLNGWCDKAAAAEHEAGLRLFHTVRKRVERRSDLFALPERLAGDRDDLSGLLTRAIEAETAMSGYTLLRKHRHRLDENLWNRLMKSAVDAPLGWEPETGRALRLAYLSALAHRELDIAVQIRLLIGEYHRRHDRYPQALHHIFRAAQMANRLDEEQVRELARFSRHRLFGMLGVHDDDPDAEQQARDAADRIEMTLQQIDLAQSGMVAFLKPKPMGPVDAAEAILGLTREIPMCDTRRQTLKALQMRGTAFAQQERIEAAAADFDAAADLAYSLGDPGTAFEVTESLAQIRVHRESRRAALSDYRRALRRANLEGDVVYAASVRNNMGRILTELGRAEDALHLYRDALPVKQEAGNAEGLAITCMGIADALSALGRKEEAEDWAERSIAELLHGEDPSSNPLAVGLYASRLLQGRRHADAADLVERAREIALFGERKPLALKLTLSLAQYYEGSGQEERAAELYRAGMDLGTEINDQAVDYLVLKSQYARFLAGRPEGIAQAYLMLAEVVEVAEARIDDAYLRARASEVVARWLHVYESLIAMLIRTRAELPENSAGALLTGDPAVSAFNLHEAAKSRSFLAQLAGSTVRAPESVPVWLREEESRLLAEQKALFVKESDSGPLAHAELNRLTELRRSLDECRKRIDPHAPGYLALRSGRPTRFAEVAGQLLVDLDVPTAIVSFFCTSATETIAFVARSDKERPEVVLCPVGPDRIRKASDCLRREFNGESGGMLGYPQIRRTRPWKRDISAFEELSEPLLRFLPAVEGIERLCIAPHGPLHLLPFHALQAPDGRYLIEHHALSYAPSISVLSYCVAGDARSRASGARPCVYAAGVAARSDSRPEFFESDDEIFHSGAWDLTVRSGVEQATRERVLEELCEKDVVHFTCHGFFDDEQPLRSGLLFSDGQVRPPRQPAFKERGAHLITAQDLLDSHMDAALVTLRACSTGLQGQRNAGDELDGLVRALLYAGAKSVIASLWNVDQQSSRELLGRFYRYWTESGKPENAWRALWRAQRDFLTADEPYLKHPYHWAPFVLFGSWR